MSKRKITHFADNDMVKHTLFMCEECSTHLTLEPSIWAKSEEHRFIFAFVQGCKNIIHKQDGEVLCRGCGICVGDLIKDVSTIRFRMWRLWVIPETKIENIDVLDVSSQQYLCNWPEDCKHEQV